jgi:hypothetical protein
MTLNYSIRSLRRRRLRGRSEPEHPAPFVVGVGRSGTTLLRMMLDTHPELAIPPETHFVLQLIQTSGKLRFNPEIAARAIVQDRNRRWNDFGLEHADLLARLQKVEPFNTADAVRQFYALYAQRHEKPRWGDKTPDYVRKMKKIQNTLPEARFIHVIRDGRDAGLSQNARIERRGHREPIPPRELARRWRKRVAKAREDADEVEGYLEIRYEDLVSDPESALRRVCELVDLAYEPAMLSYHERAAERLEEMAAALPARAGRPEREAGERVAAHEMTTKPPTTDRVAVWKQEMSADEVAEFEQMAGYLLDDLGYETTTPRDHWLPPDEWAVSHDPVERGGHKAG